MQPPHQGEQGAQHIFRDRHAVRAGGAAQDGIRRVPGQLQIRLSHAGGLQLQQLRPLDMGQKALGQVPDDHIGRLRLLFIQLLGVDKI
ncbi:hypothetical protein SDC9_203295 [bioreactor metagenome]|uniref:Uncharacterized protein n=1 Tax=bioreactor metagenome TaxID=1076179 RepID=A0A645IW92_9ZZZZ